MASDGFQHTAHLMLLALGDGEVARHGGKLRASVAFLAVLIVQQMLDIPSCSAPLKLKARGCGKAVGIVVDRGSALKP